MNGTEYRCHRCGVRVVEPDPPRTDLGPVCRARLDPTDRPALPDARGDF